MSDYRDVVYHFRVFNPNGEIAETQDFRQAYEYARYESREQLDVRYLAQRALFGYVPGEIVIVRIETGEVLAKFPGFARP